MDSSNKDKPTLDFDFKQCEIDSKRIAFELKTKDMGKARKELNRIVEDTPYMVGGAGCLLVEGINALADWRKRKKKKKSRLP